VRGRISVTAGLVAEALGAPRGARVLHVSDLHNRPAAFRLVSELGRALDPDLVVNTGDLSGIGGPFEIALLRALGRVGQPLVFVPGNHDSELTEREMRRLGAEVLSEPRLATVAGIRVWGRRDPNRTVLFGPPYDPGRARAITLEERPPEEAPYVVAVHSERMVEAVPPGVPLVLCGHVHTPAVRSVDGALFVRPGSAGGDSPWSGPLRAAVVDLDPPSLTPLGVWLLEIEGRTWRVQEHGPDGSVVGPPVASSASSEKVP
jgi:Icc-related predicted phosphoesterase